MAIVHGWDVLSTEKISFINGFIKKDVNYQSAHFTPNIYQLKNI